MDVMETDVPVMGEQHVSVDVHHFRHFHHAVADVVREQEWPIMRERVSQRVVVSCVSNAGQHPRLSYTYGVRPRVPSSVCTVHSTSVIREIAQ